MFLGIYGTSGMGRDLYELALIINKKTPTFEKIIFIDDTKQPGTLNGVEMLPFDAAQLMYPPDQMRIVIGMGEPSYKEQVWQRVKERGYTLQNMIHPDAEVATTAHLGEGVVVRKGSIVAAGARVLDNVILQNYVIVGHDATIGSHCQISSFTDVAGYCVLNDRVFVGLNACIKEHTTIGADAIIGMGAVIMKDVGPADIMMGNPARVFGKNADKKVFK